MMKLNKLSSTRHLFHLLLAIITLGITSITFLSCDKHSPKPYSYYRIDLPENSYQTYDSIYPCRFEISDYARVIPRKSNNDKEEWLDILYPQFNGRIYCAYVKVNNDFRELSEESRELVYKHTVRADAIVEHPFENAAANVYGIFYEITGNAASPLQFFLTDSTHHLLRGALYFNAVPNADSIQPVSAFIEKDVKHLVETMQWK